MLRHLLNSVVTVGMILSLDAAARGDLITFGNGDTHPLVSWSESGFTFQVVSGNQWAITSSFGNPPSSLTPGLFQPFTGDTLELFRTGGGLFTFDAFDFASSETRQSNTVDFIGEVNSVDTEQLLSISSTVTTFQNTATGFAAPIDRLRIEIASVGNTLLLLDNISVTAVPEPSAFLYGGLIYVLAGCGYRVKRRFAVA